MFIKDIKYINKLFKIVLFILVVLFISSPLFFVPQEKDFNIGIKQARAYPFSKELNDYAEQYEIYTEGPSGKSPSLSVLIGLIIKSALAFLGVWFLIIIIIAGFRWMWSGGDEDTISKARSSIKNAMIGAIITLGAYTITYYVLKALGL